MLFVLFLFLWLAAPLVELGFIIALLIRNGQYKKQLVELTRQRDRTVLGEAFERAKENASQEVLPPEAVVSPCEEAPVPVSEEMVSETPVRQAENSQMPVQETQTTETSAQRTSSSQTSGSKDNTMGTVAMIIGVVLVVLAGLVFATTTWRILPSICKVLLVLFFSGMFYGVSLICEKKLRLHRTGNAFYVLSSIFVFLTVLALAYFRLLGPAFILEGSNRWGVLCIGSFLTVWMLFLGMKRFCDCFYTQSCFWGMTVTMSFLMMACEAEWDEFISWMMVYSSLLVISRSVLKNRMQRFEETGIKNMLAQGFCTFSLIHFWFFAFFMTMYGIFTGFYGTGLLSRGHGTLALAMMAIGAAFLTRETTHFEVKVFFALALGGTIHSGAAWIYVQAFLKDWGLLDLDFSGWETTLTVLGAQIAVALCFLIGQRKKLWFRTTGGDGVFVGFLVFDELILGISAILGEAQEPYCQIGALAGAAVLAGVIACWGKEIPIVRRFLPFVFWYMLLPFRTLIDNGNPALLAWLDRGILEFLLLSGIVLWDYKRKSGFEIAVFLIGTVAQVVYFSKTQVSFPFFFLLFLYLFLRKGSFYYEAASLCSVIGAYILSWPVLPFDNGVLRGILTISVYGVWMAFGKKNLFWDICGCVLVLGLMTGFYWDGELEVWNLLLCLIICFIFYLMYYRGSRMWPHLLIALAVLPVPIVLESRYHWSENQLYLTVGGLYLASGAIARYFSQIIKQDSQVAGGYRVDFYHVLAVLVLGFMALGAPADGIWRFCYLILISLYFLQYGGIESWKRLAWCGAAGMLVIAFWSQPFVSWPSVLEVEICLLPAAGYLWFLGRLWRGRREIKTVQTAGYVLCLLTLCVDAWWSNEVINALILEGICLLVFLRAQGKKDHLWVRISGGILVVVALYMTKGFWLSISWWVYLLAAGIGLIIFAAVKEKR